MQELTNFFERRVSSYQVGVQGEAAFDRRFWSPCSGIRRGRMGAIMTDNATMLLYRPPRPRLFASSRSSFPTTPTTSARSCGQALAWMDKAAFLAASRHAQGSGHGPS